MKLYADNRRLAEQLLETAFALLRNAGAEPEECLALAIGMLAGGVDDNPEDALRYLKNCSIKHSIIGPDVVIGENTVIENSIIKNSIIGSFSDLFDIVLNESVIGSDSHLRGESRSLNIGDNTSIDLG